MEDMSVAICQVNCNFDRFSKIKFEILKDFLKNKDKKYLLSEEEIDDLFYKSLYEEREQNKLKLKELYQLNQNKILPKSPNLHSLQKYLNPI
jgi:hypothetical protein